MSENLIRKEGLDDYATGKDGQRKTIYAGNESIKFLKRNELLPENCSHKKAQKAQNISLRLLCFLCLFVAFIFRAFGAVVQLVLRSGCGIGSRRAAGFVEIFFEPGVEFLVPVATVLALQDPVVLVGPDEQSTWNA